ncbi:hypothetical protein BIT28_11945 [Photobacterium proteolyticum]|uniref:FBA domain-containing protein n=1 Tax=Photobacterium proteolyticum TaxID=1903952 RepID=A0A1Q9GF75_9GAMM|nr:hypothetical protein [Photobacterium proteolyticum]OLQ73074.1 hypothetical protein BIT28_11945 [Photobacterium proteolyticum]
MEQVTSFGNAINNTGDSINNAMQANFMEGFTEYLATAIRGMVSGQGDSSSLSPTDMADVVAEAARKSGADPEVVSQLKSLATDPEILSALTAFDQGLEGTADMADVGASGELLPDFETAMPNPNPGPTIDPGLNGNVKTLNQYSDYISGAGSTFGGTMVGLPSDLNDGASIVLNGMLLKHDNLVNELDGHLKKYPTSVTAHNLLKNAVNESTELNSSRLSARGVLNNIGTGTTVAGSLFSVVHGGINIAAGADMGKDLRIAGGTIGMAKGLYSLTNVVATQVAKRAGGGTAKNVATFLSKTMVAKEVADVGLDAASGLTKAGVGFAIGVGSALAIGMGAVSIAKNAMVADEARRGGNHGRAAMYGVMAALDGVGMVLDVVSLVCDFIPVIGNLASLVLDVVNFGLSLINTVLGFFADMVDTRTPEEKLQADFDSYLDSDAFKEFMTKQGEFYKEKGYDIFKYMVDAESAGLGEEGVDGSSIWKEETRALTDQAKKNLEDQQLRIALIDGSSIGRTLNGRENDDYLDGRSGNDIINGHGGNDILMGGAGNDELNGGDGNDNSNGGSGDDTINGGEGNDTGRGGLGADVINMGPGDDDVIGLLGSDSIDGGDDTDTLYTEDLFKNLESRELNPDWKSSQDQLAEKVANQSNWSAYAPDHEPAIGYNVDLQAGTASGNPNQQAISALDAGLYNTSVFAKKDGAWNDYHRDFSSHYLLDSLPDISVMTQLRENSVESYIAYNHHDSWNTYLFSNNPDPQIKSAYDSFVRQAKEQGREVYLLGEALTKFDPTFGYMKMEVLTDGKEVMLFDPVMGYVKLDASNLQQMLGGEEGNYRSAAGFFLYLMEKVGANATLTGMENVAGSEFDDVLKGDDNNNQLFSRNGNDKLYGRGGNDLLDGSGTGNNTLDGGEGTDTASYAVHNQGVTANLQSGQAHKGSNNTDTLAGIENLIGSAHGDTLTGNDSNNQIFAQDGNDTVRGGGGNDLIDGGKGADDLDGGDGVDTLAYTDRVGVTVDLETGENSDGDSLKGFENLMGSNGADTLKGDNESNILFGNAGQDTLEGRGGNDTLIGGDGADTLRGGSGNDRISAGDGVDVIDGGEGADILDYSLNGQDSKNTLYVDLAEGISYAVKDGQKTVLDRFSHIEGLVGGEMADTLIGDDGKNVLYGGKGNDILRGGGDNDVLVADGDVDHLFGGTGKDIYQIKVSEGGSAIIDDTDEGNAIILEGISKADVGLRFDGQSHRIQLFDRRNGQTLVEDVASGDQLTEWGGQASSEQTVELLSGFIRRFSTIRIGDRVLSSQQTIDWLSSQLIEAHAGQADSTLRGNELSNILTAGVALTSINAGGGDDQLLIGAGTPEVHTGSGNDYVDFSGNTDLASAPQTGERFIELLDDPNSLNGWQVQNGGNGFAVDANGLTSSYGWCSRTRRFDISNLVSTYGNNAINIKETFRKIGYTADSYKLTVRLLDSDGKELHQWSTGEQTVTDVAEVSHTLQNYSSQTHYVEVTDAGKDQEYWAGQWGARLEGLSLQFDSGATNQAKVYIEGFDAIEVDAGANLEVLKSKPDATFSLVLNADLNEWTPGQDGLSLIHQDGGQLTLPQKPESLIFEDNGRRILVKDVNAYYAARTKGEAFTHRWELTPDNSAILNLAGVDAASVTVHQGTVEGKKYVRLQAGSDVLFSEAIPTASDGNPQTAGQYLSGILAGVRFGDVGLHGDDLANFIDHGELPGNNEGSSNALLSEQSASVANSDADSIRLAKLTGAMAAFDSSNDGTSSGNEVLDGRYNLQPELTAAVV